MDLIKNEWSDSDIIEFQKFLESIAREKEKRVWEQRIVNTSLPCLGILSTQVGDITREISKGNFMSFIDKWEWQYHENTVIIGGLICRIKDSELCTKYLLEFSKKVDNWASIDSLKFKINKKNRDGFLAFAKRILSSEYTFTRRLGVIIMLKLIDASRIDEILNNIEILCDEQEYYVQMAIAWLISVCFVVDKEKVYSYLDNCRQSNFVVNKAISKCRDSFRVDRLDKDKLLAYRRYQK